MSFKMANELQEAIAICKSEEQGYHAQLTLLYQQLLDMEKTIHCNMQNSLLDKLNREKEKLAEKFDADTLTRFKHRLAQAGFEGLVERYLDGVSVAYTGLEGELREPVDVVTGDNESGDETNQMEDNHFNANVADGTPISVSGAATTVNQHSALCIDVSCEILQQDEEDSQQVMDMLEKLALHDCSLDSRSRSRSGSSSMDTLGLAVDLDNRSRSSSFGFIEWAFFGNSQKEEEKVKLAKIEPNQEQLLEARHRALIDLDVFRDITQVLKQIVFTHVQLLQANLEFEKVQADIEKDIHTIQTHASGSSGDAAGDAAGASEDREVSAGLLAASDESSSSVPSFSTRLQTKNRQRPGNLSKSGAGLGSSTGEDAEKESWPLVAAFDRNQSTINTVASTSAILLSATLYYLRCGVHRTAHVGISGSHCVTDCAIHMLPLPQGFDESLKPCLLRLSHLWHQHMLKAGVDQANEKSESLCRLVFESGASTLVIYGGVKIGCYLGDTVWTGMKMGSRGLKKLASSRPDGGGTDGMAASQDESIEESEGENVDEEMEPCASGSSGASPHGPDTIDSVGRCPVCMETDLDNLCVWLPCGHCICHDCGTHMIDRAGPHRLKCHHCRQPCKELKRIFLS